MKWKKESLKLYINSLDKRGLIGMINQEAEKEREKGGRMEWKDGSSRYRQTSSSLPLEAMASSLIKHVNRSHSLNAAIAEPDCFHQKHIHCPHTHTHTHAREVTLCLHTRPPKRATDGRLHTWDRQTPTASVWPQHISLHYCQQAASISLAPLLMPSASCTAILTACLSISLHPNPQSLNRSSPQPLLKMTQNTSVAEPARGFFSFSNNPQESGTSAGGGEKKNPIRCGWVEQKPVQNHISFSCQPSSSSCRASVLCPALALRC